MNITEKLAKIQSELKAPKGQMNTFGGYKYRSCEDILSAVKPLLDGLTLIINDDLVEVGGNVYVKATAALSDGEHVLAASGFAREPESKKGMDPSQITGAASSYARKYALNGLLAIDDTKDADATNTHEKEQALPAYPAKDFKSNWETWESLIAEGKATPAALIAKISTRFTLSDKQKDLLKSLEVSHEAA